MTLFTPNRRSGQALSEYLILIALIGIGSIAVVQVLGHNLKTRLAIVSENLRGAHDAHFEGKKIDQKHYRMRDLGDFNEGIQDNDDEKK